MRTHHPSCTCAVLRLVRTLACHSCNRMLSEMQHLSHNQLTDAPNVVSSHLSALLQTTATANGVGV